MLSSSDCESRTIGALLELEPDAHGRLLETWCGYTESPGGPALRQAIASLYERTSAEEVVATSCAEEGIFLLYHALLRPGDHVIVETPCYESALQVARSTGAEVSQWRRRYEDGWAHNLDALAGLIRPATRLLYLNQPHNPTGTLLPRPVFEQVIGLARARAGGVQRRGLPGTRARSGRPGAMSTSEPFRSAASPRATACRACGPAGSPPAMPGCGRPSSRSRTTRPSARARRASS
jgi:Aminotransferase class I and II